MRMVGRVLLLTILATLPLRAAAQDPDDPKAILNKAIKALGYTNQRARLHAFSCQSKATITLETKVTLELAADWSFQGVTGYRGDMLVQGKGRMKALSVILEGDKGWVQDAITGTTDTIPEDALPLLQGNFLAIRLAQRPTYLRSQCYKLSPLDEATIDQKDAVGMKVSTEGRPDVNLYFEKATGLPLKCTVRVKEGNKGKAISHSCIFGGYKEVDGVKVFTRIVFYRDGQRQCEMNLSEIQLQERLDESLFKEPS
jgi:hypothetical protein